MKRREGFTIVELVIVIAVIAILAAVLIPTFSTIIRRAKDSSIIQNDRNDIVQNYVDSVLEDNYTTTEKITLDDTINDRTEELRQDLEKLLQYAEQCTDIYTDPNHEGIGSGLCLSKRLAADDDYLLVRDLSGGSFSYVWYSYKEKYNISFNRVGDFYESLEIRFYDDINSSEDSVYYGLKATKMENETETNIWYTSPFGSTQYYGKENKPKYQIAVVRYIKPKG